MNEMQPGCQCGRCAGFHTPAVWCGGARHHFICTTRKAAMAKLHPKMAEKYAASSDMCVLAHAMGEVAENAAQNIEYLQSKEQDQ